MLGTRLVLLTLGKYELANSLNIAPVLSALCIGMVHNEYNTWKIDQIPSRSDVMSIFLDFNLRNFLILISTLYSSGAC